MSYYDNVKDSVKDEKKEAKSSSKGSGGGSGNFSTLKEEAEKGINDDENDDTPIEVLEEGGLDSGSGKSDSTASSSGSSLDQQSSSTDNTGGAVDSSGIEDKLDKIIEQNARMIEVLESFGQ